jgi:hypothetical protein
MLGHAQKVGQTRKNTIIDLIQRSGGAISDRYTNVQTNRDLDPYHNGIVKKGEFGKQVSAGTDVYENYRRKYMRESNP